jgi:muramoyltetrapeptide carboxypeptidase
VAGRLRPPALRDCATVAIVAPSSPPQTRSEIEQASEYFERGGHNLVFGPSHRRVHGDLAGTDGQRAADLQWALSEPGSTSRRCTSRSPGTGRGPRSTARCP